MAKDNVLAATRDLAERVGELLEVVRERLPAPDVEPRGYVGTPRPPRAAAMALRFCHDFEAGESLARRMRRVPDSHIGAHGREVRCVCSGEILLDAVEHLWHECPGSCGRWFVGDESGVWAVQLEGES